MNSNKIGHLLALVVMVAGGCETKGQVPKESNLTKPSTNSIAGVWRATATLPDCGDIFQPRHGTRRRVALVTFKLDGDKWSGQSDNPKHTMTAGQEGWDGKRQFNVVRFSNDRLLIEFSVEREGGKETIRIEALLRDGKLVGTWRNLPGDGAEVFAGGWEAVRAEDRKTP